MRVSLLSKKRLLVEIVQFYYSIITCTIFLCAALIAISDGLAGCSSDGCTTEGGATPELPVYPDSSAETGDSLSSGAITGIAIGVGEYTSVPLMRRLCQRQVTTSMCTLVNHS